MSFYSSVNTSYDNNELLKIIDSRTEKDVEIALSKTKLDEMDLIALLSSKADKYLDVMGELSRKITIQRFGKTIKLYTPMYLSNECINSCVYCGFNIKNKIDRISLTSKQIEDELAIILNYGIKNLLLVSGDSPKIYTDEMIVEAVQIAKKYFPYVAIEVRALDQEIYKALNNAGVDGLTMFQETYLEDEYNTFHPAGPKSDYKYRLSAPERAAKAGIRNIGLGSLLGLTDYRLEMFYLNLHTRYFMKHYPTTHISASFPRLRSSAGQFAPKYEIKDKDLYKSIFAYRLFNNDAGINISTREPQELRDRLIYLGATIMSAGSKTDPGGYSNENHNAEQFSIDDDRSVEVITSTIKSSGYEAVMKDWF